MLQAERRNFIVQYINRKGSLIVEDIAKELKTSPMTIRRDLKYLEDNNLITRTHGGAVSHSVLTDETPYNQKTKEYIDEKKRIAQFSITLIEDGHTVILDAGTTSMEIAKLLVDFKKLKVITTDLLIAAFLSQYKNIEVYCTGGIIQSMTGACSGTQAREFLQNVYADVAFLGASSIDADFGVTTPTIEKVEIKKQMIKSAETVILAADHTKFGKRSFAKICSLDELDYIITDLGINTNLLEKIQSNGIKIKAV
ncbi:MAG: transcriptional regulator, DeoR family [Clostridia bacterium]|nr:transcriptional regulator, DeoR family [Clostridia bacterium]